MNAKDAMIARGGRLKKREKHDDPRLNRGRELAWTSNRKDDRRSRPPLGRIANFTPLNALLKQVLMQIKDDLALTWLDKLKGDPNKRPRNEYCRFHWDHGHDTFECYDFKWQIEALIKQGKLQWFIRIERAGENPPRDPEPNQRVEECPKALHGEIRIIVEGSVMASSSRNTRKTNLWTVQSVQIIDRLPKPTMVSDPPISFTEEDAWQLHHPYDNALVINLSIADFNT